MPEESGKRRRAIITATLLSGCAAAGGYVAGSIVDAISCGAVVWVTTFLDVRRRR